MPIASGKSSPARAPGTIELVGPLSVPRLAFLIGLGAMTVLLHDSFNLALKMPGHHGLETMFLLVIGRLSCANPWSATIVALSAVTTAGFMSPGMGIHGGVLLLAPGLVLDLAVRVMPNWRAQMFVLPLLAATAFAMKPLIRLLFSKTMGLQYGSIQNGVMYPLSTHFLFGLTGAVIAVLVWRTTARQLRQQP